MKDEFTIKPREERPFLKNRSRKCCTLFSNGSDFQSAVGAHPSHVITVHHGIIILIYIHIFDCPTYDKLQRKPWKHSTPHTADPLPLALCKPPHTLLHIISTLFELVLLFCSQNRMGEEFCIEIRRIKDLPYATYTRFSLKLT